MEPYIIISNLNDFIFCPKSIYFHNLYWKYNQSIYHQESQTKWKINHENIDNQKYSSLKKYLQWIEIYSEKYNLAWKIDLFDKEKWELIERKTRIKEIYDGYKYQVYAQYFCLIEMWFEVKKIFFHSLEDNKRYDIKIPREKEITEFENLLERFNSFDIFTPWFTQNKEKCKKCIYSNLCDTYKN